MLTAAGVLRHRSLLAAWSEEAMERGRNCGVVAPERSGSGVTQRAARRCCSPCLRSGHGSCVLGGRAWLEPREPRPLPSGMPCSRTSAPFPTALSEATAESDAGVKAPGHMHVTPTAVFKGSLDPGAQQAPSPVSEPQPCRPEALVSNALASAARRAISAQKRPSRLSPSMKGSSAG